MSRNASISAVISFVLVFAGLAAAATESDVVNAVRLEGAERLDLNAILFYTTLKAGATYSEAAARTDFRHLWDTGFFEDLRLELDEVDDGVDLIWHVVERPVLRTIRFEGNDGVSDEDIKTRLTELGIKLETEAPFSAGQLERAKTVIEEMLRNSGYRFASVTTDVTEAPDGGRAVVINVDEGSKVKISEIDFEGNVAFSDGDLRGVFKKTKQSGPLCWLFKKCVYAEAKFNEDLERLREHYMDRGFINFQAGEAKLESIGEGKSRRLQVRIPLIEGTQFTVGKVKVEGNTAYPETMMLALNRLKTGEHFSRKKMLDSRKDMAEVYGLRGYFNARIEPRFEPAERDDVLDFTYKITESDKYYVHRINFRGNTSTKDKVIRRQLRLREGDLFNTALFKRSLLRIQQLGYFAEPQPKIEPSEEDPTKLDLTIDLQEQGRNDIRFGGGVSGVEGFFGTFAFSTRNLFGSGNSMTVDLQSGNRVRQYRLMYSDPYVFDKSISGGIDLFDRYVDLGDFEQEGTGGVAQFGLPIKDFFFFRTSYRYEQVDQAPSIRHDAEGKEVPPTETEVLLYTDSRRVSSLEPVVVYSTVDNPVRPWRGFRQVLSVEYAGGFLGGTSNLVKPRLDSTVYLPLFRRLNLAVHAETAMVKGFGGVDVPLFEKFFLGGERSLRGYRSFQVGPRDDGSEQVIGGEKMLQINTELKLVIADPVSLVLFADAGNSFTEDESISFSGLKTSFGAEVRFWTPFLQAPLRLIWSYVPEPLVFNGVADPKTDFTFSIGTTF